MQKALWLGEVGRMEVHLETLQFACLKEELESVVVGVSARQAGALTFSMADKISSCRAE